MSQINEIKQEIEKLLDAGFTDKLKIYDEVVKNLNVARPTVRRVCRELCKELIHKAEILKPLYMETPDEGNHKA